MKEGYLSLLEIPITVDEGPHAFACFVIDSLLIWFEHGISLLGRRKGLFEALRQRKLAHPQLHVFRHDPVHLINRIDVRNFQCRYYFPG